MQQLVYFLPTHCRCGGLLSHLLSLGDTRTTLGRASLDEEIIPS
jgi:hypothetical protein